MGSPVSFLQDSREHARFAAALGAMDECHGSYINYEVNQSHSEEK